VGLLLASASEAAVALALANEGLERAEEPHLA